MVPEIGGDAVVVIAAFRVADLRRLHSLLVCYESPLVTPGEASARRCDLRDAERLRRYVCWLLDGERAGVGAAVSERFKEWW